MASTSAVPMENSKNIRMDFETRGDLLYQDDQCLVLEAGDERQAPIHFKVVPKKILSRFCDATTDDEKLLGHLLVVAGTMALQKGLNTTGYHVMLDENHRTMRINSLHVFGRALHHMLWPTGPGSRL